MKEVKVKVAQSCPTLCDPTDYTVPGFLQARILEWKEKKKKRILEWVACSLLQGIFPTQESNPGLPHYRWILYQLSYQGSPELKWMGMSKYNSDDRYIYHCGQESLSRNGVALIVNLKSLKCSTGCNLKNDKMISVRFQGNPFNITII